MAEHPPELLDPVEAAWQLAVSDWRSEAYSQLVELDRTRSAHPDMALRLYWILALQPELDRTRSRHNWLVAALTRARLSGPAAELYRRELEAWPEIGLFDPYHLLLEADSAGRTLLEIARLRLDVAGLNRAWAAIDNDLLILAGRSSQLDEAEWLSHLVRVMAHVSFVESEPVYGRCVNLLASLRHLQHSESWAFDQIEAQLQTAREWRRAASIPAAVRDAVRDSWVSPESWKKSMSRAVVWATADPVAALQQFDRASKESECRRVFVAFQGLLDACRLPRALTYPSGLIRGLIREFLLSNGRESYSGMRPELLRFLVGEAIDPMELIEACAIDTALGPRALIEHVRTDSTLHMVWRTIHAFSG